MSDWRIIYRDTINPEQDFYIAAKGPVDSVMAWRIEQFASFYHSLKLREEAEFAANNP